jgi:hypothetical protein
MSTGIIDTDRLSSRETLKIWLCNPFHFLAGGQALAIGIGIVLVASFNGSVSRSHFDGVFDFHTGLPAPVWIFFVEGLIDWLCMAALLWLAGLLISKSRVRAVDVFGTQAFARFPTLGTAAAALLPGYQREAARLAVMDMTMIPLDVAAFAVVALVTILMLIWMVVLMYRAFAVSCNVDGAKAIIAFVVAGFLAEVASKFFLIGIIGRILA